MRTLILFALGVYTTVVSAQTNVNADCIQSLPLCSTPSFTFFANSGSGNVNDIPNNSNISNPNTNPASTNQGCLKSNELNPQWLLITVANAGNLEFVFGAAGSPHPQVGLYDWAMWPYSPSTCSDIQNNILPPVRCNWNSSSSGGTGIAGTIPAGGNPQNFEPPLPVEPCQQFIICISNWSGVNTLVSFQSTGTASLTCDPTCLSLTSPTVCAGKPATIIAVVSGTPSNVTYTLNPGNIVSSTPTFVLSQPVSGTYTVVANGITSNNTPFTQTAVSTVSVNPQPTVSPTFTQATCVNPANGFDFGLGFLPVGATPGYTVSWSNIPNVITSPAQTAGSGTILPGPYSATVTAQGGCSVGVNFTMEATPLQASIGLTPPGPVYSITCTQPVVTINAQNTSFNYTWTQGLLPLTGVSNNFDSQMAGTWTITAEHPDSKCTTTKTIVIGINTVVPVSVITPTFQTITCLVSASVVIATANSPTVNFTHVFISPTGGSLTANTTTFAYPPGGVGEFTHFLVNNVNGCRTTKHFSVTSNDGFPTFQLNSAAPGFTLGCNSKSVSVVTFVNGQSTPPGAKVSYTMLAPGMSSVTPSGSLSPISVYSITAPGTWTAIVKDDNSLCETRTPFVVLNNNNPPPIDSLDIARQILTCDQPMVTLRAFSSNSNTTYQWSFPGTAGTQLGDTITVLSKPLTPTQTLVANYSLTITDLVNTCKITTVIPIYQNLYPPKAAVSNGGTASLTCLTNTIMLTNQSVSGIIGDFFPRNLPVIGYEWAGPSPQLRMHISTSYVASIPGAYTIVAKDLNNGCLSNTVITIAENRLTPLINPEEPLATFTIDCGQASVMITPTVPTGSDNLTYTWTSPPGPSMNSYTIAQPNAYSEGIYRVTATDKINGCTGSASMRVVTGTLSAKIKVAEPHGYAPHNVVIDNLSESASGGGSVTSVWNFGNGVFTVMPTAGSVLANFATAGVYTVVLHATKGVCQDTAMAIVIVDLPSKADVPNIFTPNGDGVNDLFFLKATNLSVIYIKIVDRWGKVVYELDSQTGNVAWDGMNMQGSEVPDGVYMYTLKATGRDGKEHNLNGTVTVVR